MDIYSTDMSDYVGYMLDSYRTYMKHELIERSGSLQQDAERLYKSPFVVLCHDTADDPLFNYANKTAQELWKIQWDSFIGMPSRLSAEPVEMGLRRQMLDNARKQGVITNYEGIRISSDGVRFYIKNAVIWNVYNKTGEYVGQAATFAKWERV